MNAGEIARRLVGWARGMDRGMHGFLTDLRGFAAIRGWEGDGAASLAQWLSWKCGMTLGTARERIRVAIALENLQALDEALRRGEISYCKLRAVSRVATGENEAELLELARHTTGAELERICRIREETAPVDPGVARERREMTVRSLGDGTVRIEIRVLAEEAQRIVRACEATATTRLEGVIGMAEMVLRGDRPERPPVDVMVRISAETLSGEGAEGGISGVTARRLLCDGGIIGAIVDGTGATLDVGRKRRAIPRAIRRALEARDEGCRFPGCSHRRWCDGHHIEHWADGGETSLGNLVLLCSRHHTLVHEGGFAVRSVDGAVGFFDADGLQLARSASVTAPVRPLTSVSSSRRS